MNRQSFDEMIESEIARTVETFLPHGAGTMTDVRLRTALATIAKRVESASRTYYLTNLRTVEDMAIEFGVSVRRAQAIAKQAHDRWGKGMKIGKSYVFSADEIESMRPGDNGRPKSARG